MAVLSLWWREVIRFFRQRNRVVGALGTPIVFWLLIGSGFGGAYKGSGPYLEYLFPGSALLILLFAAIFSTISIIEDRREGFLQGVLASPVSRGAIVLSKLLGGTTVAVLQALVFLALAPLAGIPLTPASAALAAGIFVPIAFGLTGLGFLIAWSMESTQGFHAIMNLFLMPLWFLSGALFPVETAPAWFKVAAKANPLYYGLEAMRGALGTTPAPSGVEGIGLPLAVVAGFGVLVFVLGVAVASRRE